MVETGKFPHAGAAGRCHIHCGRQRAKVVVGADIRSRLFSSDMLFSRGKRQDKTSLAIHVCGLAHQAAGHAAHMPHPAGKHSKPRSAKRSGNAKTLTLSARYVGAETSGGFKEAVSERFSKGDDKKSPLFMNHLADDLQVLYTAKKIGGLNSNGCKIIYFIYERKIGNTSFEAGKFHNFITGRLKICLNHTTIKWINKA